MSEELKTEVAVETAEVETAKEGLVSEEVAGAESVEEVRDEWGMTAEERAEAIKQFNENDEGVRVTEHVPTAEDVAAAKKAFEESQDKATKTTYVLADEKNALRVAKFLRRWNKFNCVWEDNQFQGTIMFETIIAHFIDGFKANPSELAVDYGTLSYLYVTLPKTQGVGLAAAQKMQDTYDEYVKILESVKANVDKVMEYNAETQRLQQIWQFAENGFELVFDTPVTVEEGEESTPLVSGEDTDAE